MKHHEAAVEALLEEVAGGPVGTVKHLPTRSGPFIDPVGVGFDLWDEEEGSDYGAPTMFLHEALAPASFHVLWPDAERPRPPEPTHLTIAGLLFACMLGLACWAGLVWLILKIAHEGQVGGW